jgi:hypothetical protein
VIGGAMFAGGLATLMTASAHSGGVTASEDCSTWRATVTLADNVTADRFVDVVTTIPGTTGFTSHHYDSSFGVIWDRTGAAAASGTVTLNIFKPNTGNTGRSLLEFTANASIKPATGCTTTPALSTTPSAGGVVGTAIHDAATVTGTTGSPSGSVIFSLFDPSNATCSASGTSAVFTSTAIALTSVTPGVSTATSGAYTTTATGVYHWVAAYSGDVKYNPIKGNCADEAMTISAAAPSIVTQPSAGGPTGTAISDSATVSGGNAPTGTVTFNLYGPADATCAQTAIFTATVNLTSATVSSGAFSGTSTAGTYSWTAKYTGDANNASAMSVCSAETVVITGGGGVLRLQTVTIPNTGDTSALTGMTVGGFLLLGGLGVALVGVLASRRRG